MAPKTELLSIAKNPAIARKSKSREEDHSGNHTASNAANAIQNCRKTNGLLSVGLAEQALESVETLKQPGERPITASSGKSDGGQKCPLEQSLDAKDWCKPASTVAESVSERSTVLPSPPDRAALRAKTQSLTPSSKRVPSALEGCTKKVGPLTLPQPTSPAS